MFNCIVPVKAVDSTAKELGQVTAPRRHNRGAVQPRARRVERLSLMLPRRLEAILLSSSEVQDHVRYERRLIVVQAARVLIANGLSQNAAAEALGMAASSLSNLFRWSNGAGAAQRPRHRRHSTGLLFYFGKPLKTPKMPPDDLAHSHRAHLDKSAPVHRRNSAERLPVMSNLLQFSLGITTGQFLAGMGGATRATLGLLGAATSVHGLWEKITAQWEKGAGLEHLSRRTGESVADLFALQKGFKAVGLSADDVGRVIFTLQKSIGGFNEFGEPTKDIFAALGLGVEKLKQLNAPAQLQAVGEKLAALKNDEATKAASLIFGRSGAGDVLQIARSGEEFAAAIGKAANQGAIMAAHAHDFERVLRLGASLGKTLDGIFLGLAGHVSDFVLALEGAGKQNKLGEFLELSLVVGMQKASDYIMQSFAAIAAAIPALFEASGHATSGIFDKITASLLELNAVALDKLADKAGGKAGAGLRKSAELSAQLAEVGRERAPKAAAEAAKAFLDGMRAAFAVISTNLTQTPEGKKLEEMIRQFKGGDGAHAPGTGGLGNVDNPKEKHLRATDGGNAFERIGAFFGGGNSGLTYARETANSTKQALVWNARIHSTLERISRNLPGSSFANV